MCSTLSRSRTGTAGAFNRARPSLKSQKDAVAIPALKNHSLRQLMIRKSRNELEYQEKQQMLTYQNKMKLETQKSLILFNKNNWNEEIYTKLQNYS